MADLASAMVNRFAYRWSTVEAGELAAVIGTSLFFDEAWLDDPPVVRHVFVRAREQLRPAPLGLEAVPRPHWPTAGDLAAWLGIGTAGLWRLTLPPNWQRRQPVTEQHYGFGWRAKRDGGARLIEAPLPHLKALQRRLLQGVLAYVPPHEAACGFVRGHSVLDHAARHTGQAVLLRFDLQDFFGHVRAARVHALWRTLGYPIEVARMLTALTTVATPEAVLLRGRQAHGLPWAAAQRLRDAHLPQGAPTSPALANLAAFGLDLRLASLAASMGAAYSRYADDIALSGGAKLAHQRERIAASVSALARDEGFVLNHRKTRCLGAGSSQRLCGVVVNAHPNLPRVAFDRLKASLHRAVRDGVDPAERDRLRGAVSWALQVNPDRGAKLQRLFERIDEH